MRKRGKQLNQLLKFTPLVSDKKDSNTDLPDSKAHALKYYPVVCLYFLYQSCTGTQFKESNNSKNFVKKNCSPWHPLPCTREENYFSWVFLVLISRAIHNRLRLFLFDCFTLGYYLLSSKEDENFQFSFPPGSHYKTCITHAPILPEVKI